MKRLFNLTWPIFTLIVLWIIISYPFWFKGLIPAPLDFLVGFFSPWQSHFQIPIKNSAIPDIVNQIIPWKIFTISSWQEKIIPLWNPYNLSGTPHAANWQSAVFYPLNIIFFVTNFINAWSLFILCQPLLAGIFTYLFARNLKLSPLSALLSALSFAFSGFMTSWLEWGTLGHALLWLPASLWSIEKYAASHHGKYLILNSLFLSLSLLAGHLQISLYVIITSLAYFIYRLASLKDSILNGKRRTLLLFGFLVLITPFLLTAFQFFPSLELYFQSLRSQAISPDWFKFFRIPIEYLITYIAPDFFGNPTTRNLWGSGSYVEMMGYIGLVPLIFALTTIIKSINPGKSAPLTQKWPIQKFFTSIIFISLLFSLKTPIANILFWLKIPILATSSPARITALISFSLSILAGIGLEQLIQRKMSLNPSLRSVGIMFATLWLITLIGPSLNQNWAANLNVARRNLIFPSLIFIMFIGGYFILDKIYRQKILNKKLFTTLFSSFIILVCCIELFRFHHKFTPYSLREYWYPTFGIRQKLTSFQGIDRHLGLFDANLNLPFNLYSAEGYDPLYPNLYGELISAHKTGKISLSDRSSGVQIGKNELFTMPLLNLLSVKYVIQPTVHGSAPWEFRLWEYSDQFELLYDDSFNQIFDNKKALPRFFLTTDYKIETAPQKIIDQLFAVSGKTIILETAPNLNITKSASGEINLLNYKSNVINFSVNTSNNSLLYLNDNFYPGWQATVDGKPTPILKANYAFRAIAVPAGEHQVVIKYAPFSFTIGLFIATLSFISLLFLGFKKHV